jgi:hypothetical protein
MKKLDEAIQLLDECAQCVEEAQDGVGIAWVLR